MGQTEHETISPKLTPVEFRNGITLKRDDLYEIAGAPGGKARTCWHLAQGAKGLVTASSRHSPQVGIVARIAHKLGIPCRCHMPSGPMTPEMEDAAALGAELIQHKPGHNSVIKFRARKDAKERLWHEIPFGMECYNAVYLTSQEVLNIPHTGRVVVPVGSGMSLAGILTGLLAGPRKQKALGVVVGADPIRRLDKWAPLFWRRQVELVKSPFAYDEPAAVTNWGGVELDPTYEAKCLPFLEPGDIFWIVGIRPTLYKRPPL